MSKEVQRNTERQDQAVQPVVERRAQVAPRARVGETKEAYELKVELPGVEEQALRIGIEQRTLTVEAESTTTARDGYRLVREEFPPAAYRAVFEVPEQVDASAIKARLANGVLTVTLPKREEVKPRRIAVNVE